MPRSNLTFKGPPSRDRLRREERDARTRRRTTARRCRALGRERRGAANARPFHRLGTRRSCGRRSRAGTARPGILPRRRGDRQAEPAATPAEAARRRRHARDRGEAWSERGARTTRGGEGAWRRGRRQAGGGGRRSAADLAAWTAGRGRRRPLRGAARRRARATARSLPTRACARWRHERLRLPRARRWRRGAAVGADGAAAVACAARNVRGAPRVSTIANRFAQLGEAPTFATRTRPSRVPAVRPIERRRPTAAVARRLPRGAHAHVLAPSRRSAAWSSARGARIYNAVLASTARRARIQQDGLSSPMLVAAEASRQAGA